MELQIWPTALDRLQSLGSCGLKQRQGHRNWRTGNWCQQALRAALRSLLRTMQRDLDLNPDRDRNRTQTQTQRLERKLEIRT